MRRYSVYPDVRHTLKIERQINEISFQTFFSGDVFFISHPVNKTVFYHAGYLDGVLTGYCYK